jgi:hypothetical protein
VASVKAHAVVKRVLALSNLLVSRVSDPAVRLEEHGGAEVLLLIPPVGWARSRAAGAENAFVKTVELLTLFLGLAVFAALDGVSGVSGGSEQGDVRQARGCRAGGRA